MTLINFAESEYKDNAVENDYYTIREDCPNWPKLSAFRSYLFSPMSLIASFLRFLSFSGIRPRRIAEAWKE